MKLDRMEPDMKSAEEAVAEVVAEFRKFTEAFEADHESEINRITSAIDEIGYDAAGDYLADLMDDLRGVLGSEAANLLDDEEEQEAAISAAEEWVGDNVANQGSREAALAALFLNGCSSTDKICVRIRGMSARPSLAP